MIPEDWDVRRIVDVAAITTGSRNTQDRIADGKYPFFVRSQTVERINSYSFDGEAVLTAGDGVGTGKIFHYINGKFDCHQRVYRMSHFNGVNGVYFFKVFSERFYDRIMSMTAKSSVDSVRREMIADMMIPVPSVPEQEAIAEALSDMDEAIAAQEAVIAKKRALKTATMQALLSGTHRLPGFTREWEEKALGRCLKVRHGRSQVSVETIDGNYPILATGGEIGRASACLHPGPSVLIGRKGTIDRPQYCEGPFWSIDTLFYTDIDASTDAKFLFYIFQMIDWRTYNEASGVPSLSSSTIEAIEVKMPDFDEQSEIAKVITDIDLDLQMNEAKLSKLRQIKAGMMQQLLTGKIRLV